MQVLVGMEIHGSTKIEWRPEGGGVWQGRNDPGRGNSLRPTSHGEYFNASARGGGSSN
jgi:hypothetical protein